MINVVADSFSDNQLIDSSPQVQFNGGFFSLELESWKP